MVSRWVYSRCVKLLHTPHLFAWSHFDEARNIDFHSVLWRCPEGNVAIDPLPLSEHDQRHVADLGGVSWIVITNSDHVRDALALQQQTGARIFGPEAERDSFPITCDGYLRTGSERIQGLEVIALDGSKTPGELALILEDTTLITGDLIRCHQGGRLHLLPDGKLTDKAAALKSIRLLTEYKRLETVIVGDGWPLFSGAQQALQGLLQG